LEQQFPDIGQTQPEVLALHLTEAGLTRRAIPYWRRAGELAAGRSAHSEAIAHLSKGLELVATLPSGAEQLEEELTLRLAIGGSLMATKSYAAPETEQTYKRAWALCDQLDRAAELFAVLRGLWNCYLVRAQYQRAHEFAEQLVELAEGQGAPVPRALARRAQGTTLFFLGRFANAKASLDGGIAIDDAVAAWEDPAHLLLYPERAGVVCRLYSAWALWYLGFPDSALQNVEAGLALAERLTDASGLTRALIWAAALHNLRREFDAAHRRAKAAIEIARKHRMMPWFGHASVCWGFALSGLGHRTKGVAEIQTGMAARHVTGARMLNTQWLGFLAGAYLQAGQLDNALAALDQAAETVAATDESHYQAELYRLKGAVLAATGDKAEAPKWFHHAIDTAQSQQARSFELRAATSLALLWRDQGKRGQARGLLAPVYGWFTEGFDTADLKDAKALLDELA
jgi:predicted ATPase